MMLALHGRDVLRHQILTYNATFPSKEPPQPQDFFFLMYPVITSASVRIITVLFSEPNKQPASKIGPEGHYKEKQPIERDCSCKMYPKSKKTDEGRLVGFDSDAKTQVAVKSKPLNNSTMSELIDK